MDKKEKTKQESQTLSDEALAVLAKEDEQALEFLMERYKNLVRARARGYYLVGGDREDLLQEGMVGLYKAIMGYESEKSSFSTFANLCVTRQILTAIQADSRQKHIPLNTALSFYHPIEDETKLVDFLSSSFYPSPEEALLDREEMERKKTLITKHLSVYEKEVLDLYLTGKSYREIATLLQRSEKSIDNALQRIKAKLQNVSE